MDDKQQNFYKRLLINIQVKCLKQGIKKSEFCLKQGRTISDICLKQGQGMRGRAAPPHRGIYRVPPEVYSTINCLVQLYITNFHTYQNVSYLLSYWVDATQCFFLLQCLSLERWLSFGTPSARKLFKAIECGKYHLKMSVAVIYSACCIVYSNYRKRRNKSKTPLAKRYLYKDIMTHLHWFSIDFP